MSLESDQGGRWTSRFSGLLHSLHAHTSPAHARTSAHTTSSGRVCGKLAPGKDSPVVRYTCGQDSPTHAHITTISAALTLDPQDALSSASSSSSSPIFAHAPPAAPPATPTGSSPQPSPSSHATHLAHSCSQLGGPSPHLLTESLLHTHHYHHHHHHHHHLSAHAGPDSHLWHQEGDSSSFCHSVLGSNGYTPQPSHSGGHTTPPSDPSDHTPPIPRLVGGISLSPGTHTPQTPQQSGGTSIHPELQGGVSDTLGAVGKNTVTEEDNGQVWTGSQDGASGERCDTAGAETNHLVTSLPPSPHFHSTHSPEPQFHYCSSISPEPPPHYHHTHSPEPPQYDLVDDKFASKQGRSYHIIGKKLKRILFKWSEPVESSREKVDTFPGGKEHQHQQSLRTNQLLEDDTGNESHTPRHQKQFDRLASETGQPSPSGVDGGVADTDSEDSERKEVRSDGQDERLAERSAYVGATHSQEATSEQQQHQPLPPRVTSLPSLQPLDNSLLTRSTPHATSFSAVTYSTFPHSPQSSPLSVEHSKHSVETSCVCTQGLDKGVQEGEGEHTRVETSSEEISEREGERSDSETEKRSVSDDSEGRRESVSSVVSEGGGVRGVNRVVSSTLCQWRRLQGSVGCLTTALKQRYHHHRLITRHSSRSTAGHQRKESTAREGQELAGRDKQPRAVCPSPRRAPRLSQYAAHRLTSEKLLSSDLDVDNKEQEDKVGEASPDDSQSRSFEYFGESIEQSTSESNGVSRSDVNSLASVEARESLSVCTSPVGVSSPSTSSGTTSSDDTGDTSTGTVIFRSLALESLDDDEALPDEATVKDKNGIPVEKNEVEGLAVVAEKDLESPLVVNGEVVASGSHRDTPGALHKEEEMSEGRESDSASSDTQDSSGMPRRGNDGGGCEGEPTAKRPSLAGVDHAFFYHGSPPLTASPSSSPSTPHSTLSMTRKRFCEAMISGGDDIIHSDGSNSEQDSTGGGSGLREITESSLDYDTRHSDGNGSDKSHDKSSSCQDSDTDGVKLSDSSDIRVTQDTSVSEDDSRVTRDTSFSEDDSRATRDISYSEDESSSRSISYCEGDSSSRNIASSENDSCSRNIPYSEDDSCSRITRDTYDSEGKSLESTSSDWSSEGMFLGRQEVGSISVSVTSLKLSGDELLERAHTPQIMTQAHDDDRHGGTNWVEVSSVSTESVGESYSEREESRVRERVVSESSCEGVSADGILLPTVDLDRKVLHVTLPVSDDLQQGQQGQSSTLVITNDLDQSKQISVVTSVIRDGEVQRLCDSNLTPVISDDLEKRIQDPDLTSLVSDDLDQRKQEVSVTTLSSVDFDQRRQESSVTPLISDNLDGSPEEVDVTILGGSDEGESSGVSSGAPNSGDREVAAIEGGKDICMGVGSGGTECEGVHDDEHTNVVVSGAGPKILITAATNVGSGNTPTFVLESGSAASGWGGSLEGAVFATQDSFTPTSTLAAHLAAHPRPPTPKSPITVDEWVAALPPHNISTSTDDQLQLCLHCTHCSHTCHPLDFSEEDEVDTSWVGSPTTDDHAEDSLNLGAEAGYMCGSESMVTSSVTTTGTSRFALAAASVTASAATAAGAVSLSAATKSVSCRSTANVATSLMTGHLHQSHLPLHQPNQQDEATGISSRPVTLGDVANSLQSLQEQQESSIAGVEGKRSQFASLREKQSSFQSELSGLSFHSNRSSIDSLLESRQADPVEVLLSLGFGGPVQDGISRIPERFLKPSKVPGNDIEEFIRSEDEISEMMETAEMMPGIDPQALRRSSVATVSPLMSQLLDNLRENRSRFIVGNSSEGSSHASTAPVQSTGIKRFAAVAKKTVVKASVMSTLAAAGRPNRLLSVLNPENRRLLDLQGQKSPEVPRKRLIIGQSSFGLDRDGQLLNDDDELGDESPGSQPETHDDLEENEETGNPRDEEDPEESREHNYQHHTSLHHKDSVWSMASSATSIDSSEEELRDQRRRLQLSLTHHPLPADAPDTPTTPADSLDSPQPLSGTTDTADRRRKLLKRLASNKRISTVSSNSSREVDDLIPEEEWEEENNLEPAHHQMICEVDASVHSSSDTGACPHSIIPQHFTQSLSQHMHTHSSAHMMRSGPDSGHSMLGQVSTQGTFVPTHLPLRCSLCWHDPAAHHPNMFSSSVTAMENHNETARCHVLAWPTGTAEYQCVPQQRSTGCLRRQQHVDDGCADVSCQSPPALQKPWPHVPQHHMHNLASDQARFGSHEGSQDDGGRLGASGHLCRSGSAQSDSSGFMEGDAVDGDARGPSMHPPSVSAVPPSASAAHSTGHGWWWSRETGCSTDTIRHAPLSRTLALHPGQSSQGHLSHRTLSLDPMSSRRDHISGTQGGCIHGVVPAHGCRIHDTSHHVDHSVTMNSLTGTSITNSHPSIHHTHSSDCSLSSLSHNTNPPLLYPSRSLENSAFKEYSFQNLLEQSSAASKGQRTSPCMQCLPSYTDPASTFNYHHPETRHRQQHTSSQLGLPDPKLVRHRRHSLPEPLPSSQASEIQPHNVAMLHRQSSQPKSSHPQPQQLPQSSWLVGLQPISLSHRQPATSEYVFPPTNSNSLASPHFPSVTSVDDRRPVTAVSHHMHQPCQPPAQSHELLSILQSYRQQMVQQEQLSRQLYALAAETPTCPATTQHLYLQLYNIRAIRAAIHAEVTYMEQLMAEATPNSFTQSCISSVVSQMMILLQQQSQLCHDLEALTLASQRTSPEPPAQSISGHDPPSSHSHFSSQSVKPLPPQNSLRDSATSPDPPEISSASLSSESHKAEHSGDFPNATIIPELSEHNLGSAASSSDNVTLQNKSVPVKLEKFFSTVAGTQKACDNDNTPSSPGTSSYFSIEKDQCYHLSHSQESSSYSGDSRNLVRNNIQTQNVLRQEAQLGGEPPPPLPALPPPQLLPVSPPPSTTASWTTESHAIQPSDINGQVAELVRQQVLDQTEVFQEQLQRQTRDMADIKDMMQLLLNKLQ
ncbi:uncharacterized protein [Cherax quadricarinatus]|uniref:uncharacterized protein isoform X4 n=1 Tax=Cherax quadricarinatus TaxID=27406 RepID=UPI00387E3826